MLAQALYVGKVIGLGLHEVGQCECFVDMVDNCL